MLSLETPEDISISYTLYTGAFVVIVLGGAYRCGRTFEPGAI